LFAFHVMCFIYKAFHNFSLLQVSFRFL